VSAALESDPDAAGAVVEGTDTNDVVSAAGGEQASKRATRGTLRDLTRASITDHAS
jgi:hypothetical protein